VHATDRDEDHPESVADEQEATMFPEANTTITFADMHREDLLATAARERRMAGVSGPALSWRPLAVRVLALVAVLLGLHR
jgi:hypothetical protein